MAAVTELTPMASPSTHSTTAKPIVPSMIFSSLLMGPIFSNLSAAAFGASGVSLISGGLNCSQQQQQSKRCLTAVYTHQPDHSTEHAILASLWLALVQL